MGHPPVADPESPVGISTLVVGTAPIRIVLFGAGPLVGYGVTTRAEAMDGPLAEMVADRTGRGVVLESRVRVDVTVADSVASLGGSGTASFSVAVWSPSFLEGVVRQSRASWRRELQAMCLEFRRTSDAPLVIALLPLPLRANPIAVSGRRWANRINAVIDEVAATQQDVRTVAVEPFSFADLNAPMTDPALFRRAAALVAPVVLHAVGITPVPST